MQKPRLRLGQADLRSQRLHLERVVHQSQQLHRQPGDRQKRHYHLALRQNLQPVGYRPLRHLEHQSLLHLLLRLHPLRLNRALELRGPRHSRRRPLNWNSCKPSLVQQRLSLRHISAC